MHRDSKINILMLTHDVSDPATRRRVSMLVAGGAHVSLAGFRRSEFPIAEIEGCPVTDLGQTSNGAFLQRIAAVLRTLFCLKSHRSLFDKADVVVARNLEMLAVAVRGQSLTNLKPFIVYEVLDIHRLLLRRNIIGMGLRWLEGWLARRCAAIITSSPAFVENYFDELSHAALPIRIVENKVLDVHGTIEPLQDNKRADGPPWIIGWYGNLRCSRSLALLRAITMNSDGRVEVVIRGRPSLDQMPDFHKIIDDTPGMRYLGTYKNPEDLPDMYKSIHFAWIIDLFEEGLNSTWLLPNRLYEGCAFGVVPLALDGVETSHAMKSLHIGVTFTKPQESEFTQYFKTLTQDTYSGLVQAVAKISPSTWICGQKECEELVAWLRSL